MKLNDNQIMIFVRIPCWRIKLPYVGSKDQEEEEEQQEHEEEKMFVD
jgi:hypothetical protein